MKYQGKIIDPKDLVTKEYTDNKIASTSNLLKGDGNGNAVAASQVATSLLEIDSAPTASSENLVESGGVYTAVNAKYTKPADGIPKSDLTTALQNSIDNAVHYTAETKTTEQKTQARANIDAGSISAIDGSPSDPELVNADLLGGTAANQFRTASAQNAIDATKQDILISSGATVGQFAKVSAVDANGKPTAWTSESILYTLTITCLTQDSVTVTGQTVTVRADSATGPIYSTLAYNGQPVSVAVPTGFVYYVSVTDNLPNHFGPNKANGIITNANASVTLTYKDVSSVQTFMDVRDVLNLDIDCTQLVGEQVSATRGNETIVWDIVDYDSATQSVTLLTHDTIGNFNVEPSQTLMWCENGLAEGVYKFKIDSTYYYFTLATAIPAGGQLKANTTSFSTFASIQATSTSSTGSVSTTEIADATDLGTAASGLLNHIDRVSYGSNNFGESWIKQMLNSNAAPNTYLQGTTKFCRPASVGAYGGFLYGFDSEALSCVADTTWKCSANRVYEAPSSLGGITTVNGTYTVTSKFALASTMEIFGTYDGVPAGDAVFDLYQNATATDRIKYRGGTAQWWWNRSPHPSNAHDVRFVDTSGTVNYNLASRSRGVVPACRISKSTNL